MRFNLLILCLISFALSTLAQEELVYSSKKLPKNDTVWVFTPKNFQADQKLPLVYLLHGYSGNYQQWNKIMNAQQYADEYGFIIVCPDGLFNSWYINSPLKKNSQYEDFFFMELYPAILKKYHPDPNKIFISGLSMGGHGALHLFIQQPTLFASAGSTSGGINLSDGEGKWGLNELLGKSEKNLENWKRFSVIENIDKIKDINKSFIFDCGMDDFFYQSNTKFKQKCDELKLKATYISQPGAHNRIYWAKSIRQHFDFYKNILISQP